LHPDAGVDQFNAPAFQRPPQSAYENVDNSAWTVVTMAATKRKRKRDLALFTDVDAIASFGGFDEAIIDFHSLSGVQFAEFADDDAATAAVAAIGGGGVVGVDVAAAVAVTALHRRHAAARNADWKVRVRHGIPDHPDVSNLSVKYNSNRYKRLTASYVRRSCEPKDWRGLAERTREEACHGESNRFICY
jgi:hypothetical protein